MTFLKAPFRVRAPQPPPAAGQTLAPQRTTPPGDPYLTRLVKLIPAEIVTLYLTFKGFDVKSLPIEWVAAVCLVLVIFARTFGTREEGKPIQFAVVFFSTISFILWVYATDGAFPHLSLDTLHANSAIISFAIAVWTFVVPSFYKGGD